MVMSAMIMGKIRFTEDNIRKKLFQTKIALCYWYIRWHKIVIPYF